ncbi:glycosyltransferase family 28 protein, putative [Trypanosoma brucei gambiense DAL972]|nr:glycosyltransferase family 28 protein, putative [Trypanosoma brucei gambiense DAL972]CBH11690.1 glycosyltransferase family 28 protein, putative [Trypanosoma brucei gambiense DAL972]|eukprot:XP_011773975.1 glycosyltransferase family 28 protein, putative [Trypanosoma brucei gambiense DAL972]
MHMPHPLSSLHQPFVLKQLCYICLSLSLLPFFVCRQEVVEPMALFLWLVLAFSLLVWRFASVLRSVPAPRRRCGDSPLRVCVVLGSGGHTSEMMRIVETLKTEIWGHHRPFYVVSSTDSHSASLAKQFEERNFGRCCRLHIIPRAREVGQSYFLSIFTTLRALWSCVFLALDEKPDVILVNGPGVCVPVVAGALLVAILIPSSCYCRPAIAFIETYSSVSHMSVSGKLLGPISDVCVVQWLKLYENYQHKWWWGCKNIFFVGTRNTAEENGLQQRLSPMLGKFDGSEEGGGAGSMALVTVGSTQFTPLIEAVDNEEVLRALAKRGITQLLVQKGTSPYVNRISFAHGVSVEVFPYRPKLHEIIQKAALVISHAGAGTILEVLESKKPMIAVPNRALMLDHQLEFAEALSNERYIYCVQVADLCKQLQRLDLGALRVYPGADTAELLRLLTPLFSL